MSVILTNINDSYSSANPSKFNAVAHNPNTLHAYCRAAQVWMADNCAGNLGAARNYGFLEAIRSPYNTQGELYNYFGNSSLRNVEVKYRRRFSGTQSPGTVCSATTQPTYGAKEVAVTQNPQWSFQFDPIDMSSRFCEPDAVQKEFMKSLEDAIQKVKLQINDYLWTTIAAPITNNVTYGPTNTASLPAAPQSMPIINTDGAIDFASLAYINSVVAEQGCNIPPIVIGGGFRLDEIITKGSIACCNTNIGLDPGTVGQFMLPYKDNYTKVVANGFARNAAVVLVPGAWHLVSWHRFPANGYPQGIGFTASQAQYSSIIDPSTGIIFDVSAVADPCGGVQGTELVKVKVEAFIDVFTTLDDLYEATDPLYGTNGVFLFEI